MLLYASIGEWGDLEDVDGITRYGHLVGYVLGTLGGLSGVGMYYLVTMGQEKVPQPASNSDRPTPEQMPIVTTSSWDDDLEIGVSGMVSEAAVGRWNSPR